MRLVVTWSSMVWVYFLTSVTRLGIFNRFLRQILFQKQPNTDFMGYFEKHQILIKTNVATFRATINLLD